MNPEWLVPYLLVALLVFLMPKIFGMLGKGKSTASGKPAFVPHYIYVLTGIIVAGILLYTAAKVIITVVCG
ncbi:hypothetical protein GeomeDRAFT_0429 [Geobacter metallireducens RCH3]|uniref:Uncharacterized protein n=1 Tax=Geobacter metallireducens (strain ATCC 53774 / DSM 7210 / GS-15) TaxID=269799 RepID=J9JEN9_GEOMG|nr:hypothetical protein [Geobacter metallireducens]AFR42839.1 hypothetical protein Gmet_3621 [Geobacter metallireducens GS-15]EHP88997.1 hypothetical protein GeomeDRAFT_0429 [Geobacter metallireducens RCH3]